MFSKKIKLIVNLLLKGQESLVNLGIASWFEVTFNCFQLPYLHVNLPLFILCTNLLLFYGGFLFTFKHAVDFDRKCVVHKMLHHVVSYHLQMLSRVVKNRLLTILHFDCLIFIFIPDVLANCFIGIFFRQIFRVI